MNNNKSLSNITDLVMQLAKDKGFGSSPSEIILAEKIALIHSEVSEAYEAYRKQNINGQDGFKEELADVVIRVIHLCGIFEIDIQAEILKKLEFNKNREWNWKKSNEKKN